MFKSIVLVLPIASMAVAQGVTAVLTPTAAAPSGCATSYPGTFEITALNITKRDISERDIEKRAALTITLAGGKLTDSEGRTGYIAANHQFQFDGPPQTGAIYTAGWSACADGSLALGGSTTFYTCASGNPDGGEDGSFYNIYDDQAFDICSPAELKIIGGSSAAGQQPDGQPTASPVSQITDGQVQQPTGTPPISQISDGQIQQPTGLPISQLSDGQPQAPSGLPISQISDGQPQAPSGLPISQISDGQPQAPTATLMPTTTGPAISQISDGQIQAPTGSNLTSTPTQLPFTGGSASVKVGLVTVFAAVLSVCFL